MNEQQTWMGVAIVALTMAGGIMTAFMGYLNKRVDRNRERDKLEFSAELATIKAQQEQCEEESKRCNEEHANAKAEIAQLHARDAADKAELKAEIATIRQKVGIAPLSGKNKQLPPGTIGG